MNKLFFSKLLMIAAIVFIAAFQTYWLNKLYNEEWNGLKKETDVLLRNAVQQLQNKNFRFDFDSNHMKIPMPDKFREANIAEGKTPTIPPAIVIDKFSTDTIKIINDKQLGKTFFKKGFKVKADAAHVSTENQIINDSHFIVRRVPLSIINSEGKIDSIAKLAGKSGNVKIVISTNDSGKLPPDLAAFTSKLNQQKNKTTLDTTVILNNTKNKNFIRATFDAKGMNASEQLKNLVLKVRSLYDSIPIKKVDSVYKIKLAESKIKLTYTIKMYEQKDVKIDTTSKKLSTGYAEIGFDSPYAYKASFTNPFWFIVQKISMPITVSLLLIILTTLSFIYLYRNLAAQQKLALIKDEFISNITHELKTPIATVNVAIEALKNFDAIQNPEKTKEYLNISSSELQRLSLLVDKVLKLSMFESKAIELNIESVDIKQLAEEVISSMQLQAMNQHASLKLGTEGNYFLAKADRLHITSVLFNLLDNALKYSGQNAEVQLSLKRADDKLIIAVKDNGIGIAPEYQHKIFDKFFRVPTGGHHNVKGYGLGLSYVAEIIKKHNGSITVESTKGNGSTFIIQLPIA
jgi:two-component system phosphate regulon sensor histidine kinase PhoR